MGGRRRRSRVEPTDELRSEQRALLCNWPEQLAYNEIRPLPLFGASVLERARETVSVERTLYRRVSPITRPRGSFPVYRLCELRM
jgi:hypothetical protein